MIYGENRVEEYSTVQAFAVDAGDSGIISGGGGNGNIIVEGTTFFWIYDPDTSAANGFTGVGWFEGTAGSPIAVATERLGITYDDIMNGFREGTRTNLNDVFEAWQSYIEASGQTGIVSGFVNTLVLAGGSGCWTQ